MFKIANNLFNLIQRKQSIPALLCVLILAGLILFSRGEKTPEVAKNTAEATAATSDQSAAISEADKKRIAESFGKLPLAFEANTGQYEKQVKFITRGKGYTMFLTGNEAVLSLRNSDLGLRNENNNPKSEIENPKSNNSTSTTVRMKLVGANATPTVTAQDELPGKTNYFKGSDRSQWRTNVPNYKKVHYDEVYPGIDLVYYGNQRRLEYDFVVNPGINPDVIALEFDGLTAAEESPALEIADNGDLLLHTEGGTIQQHKPIIYQEIDGERQPVDGSYRLLADARVGFEVGAYDAAETLVIDPVLVYATYLGGSEDEDNIEIAVDGSGSAYVAGETFSTDFPTVNAFDGTLNDGIIIDERDIFVTKFSVDGQSLVYSTYLGGTDGENGIPSIVVDGSGNAYIAGETSSLDFPTFNAFDGTFNSTNFPNPSRDIFVTKLSTDGQSLVYSTYLGGETSDCFPAIAIDAAGSAYVAGDLRSTNFPTVNAFQPTIGGSRDLFVTKFSPDGMSLVYSTYLGGSDGEAFEGFSQGIAVDAFGNAYIAGETNSTDFPTLNAFSGTHNSPGNGDDVTLTKFSTDGQSLVYSTYLGGAADDDQAAVTVDGAGHAYVVGATQSTDFPTLNAFSGTHNSTNPNNDDDVFLTKFSTDGMSLVFSTYLGGTLDDDSPEVVVDGSGNVYVAGETRSPDFPTVDALDGTLNDGINTDGGDVFVTQFDNTASTLLFSTYLGGTESDDCPVIVLDGQGNAYIVGETNSTDFPTLNAFSGAHNSINPNDDDDAFLVKIGGFPSDADGPHVFTILAEEDITLQKDAFVEGNIHSNDMAELKKRSELQGSASASDKIELHKDAEISGNVTAPEVDDKGADVGGTITEDDVDPIPLPDLPAITPGSENIEVAKGETLNLAPGMYRNIKVRENATLNLEHNGVTGDYHIREIEVGKRAVVNLDATGGEVNLFIERKIEFIKEGTFNAFDGPNPTTKVTIWSASSSTMSVRRGAVFNGCNLIAPEARIKFQKQSFFKGLVCAERVEVQKQATVVFHTSSETPKTVELLALAEEDVPMMNSDAAIPATYELDQNYPNPFNPTTTIKFGLPEASEVSLKVFNVRGQLVRTLASGNMEAGYHQIQWDATNENGVKVGSGMYFYQIQAKDFQQVKKMLLLK